MLVTEKGRIGDTKTTLFGGEGVWWKVKVSQPLLGLIVAMNTAHFNYASRRMLCYFCFLNPDTFRMCVEGQIRFEYATCGWKYFLIRKEKVAD